jgi:hypothetical protein
MADVAVVRGHSTVWLSECTSAGQDSSGLDEMLGVDRMTSTLRFILGHPDLGTTMEGSNSGHLGDNLEVAAKGALPVSACAEAKRRLAAPGSVWASGE